MVRGVRKLTLATTVLVLVSDTYTKKESINKIRYLQNNWFLRLNDVAPISSKIHELICTITYYRRYGKDTGGAILPLVRDKVTV